MGARIALLLHHEPGADWRRIGSNAAGPPRERSTAMAPQLEQPCIRSGAGIAAKPPGRRGPGNLEELFTGSCSRGFHIRWRELNDNPVHPCAGRDTVPR